MSTESEELCVAADGDDGGGCDGCAAGCGGAEIRESSKS